MLDMNLNLDAMRKEVGEIMDARGLSLRDLATTLDTLPSHNTLANFLDGASSSPELVADLAKWMGKSLREFETWHPKPAERSSFLPPLSTLAKLQGLLKEAKISPKMAKLLVDLVELEAKERLEKSRREFMRPAR